MQCPEFEQRLQVAADLREDPPVDAEFDLHASLCADCSAKRDWFVALSKMTGAFHKSAGFAAVDGRSSLVSYDRVRLIRETCSRSSQDEVVLAPAPLATAPVASALMEAPRRRSRLLLAGSGLAVAASIALFVTLAFLPSSQRVGQPVGGERVDAALAPPKAPAREKAPVPAAVVAETRPIEPAAAAPGFMLSGAEGSLSLEQLRQRLSSLPSDPSMTGSLRPIASSFGVAWETLRSALPTGHGATDPALDQADVRGSGPFAAV
ncbi:MAG TPA: hypothetical protein VGN57_01095 [Pirellulaceae bacterium]|jgi:hypothetical protein|nr:hypothetical protein [Pirellulaceae bacterium]